MRFTYPRRAEWNLPSQQGRVDCTTLANFKSKVLVDFGEGRQLASRRRLEVPWRELFQAA